MLSITLMGASFKLLGHDFAKALVESVSNPFTALLIGILATSIIQSSSATSSLVVGLVGGISMTGIQTSVDPTGEATLSIYNAIPIIIGANIGTSVTNTLVSLGHISRRLEFLRAFSAAIVHDVFNLMAVVIFLPIQLATNFLGIAASETAGLFNAAGGLRFASPIKAITKPVIDLIMESPLAIGWLDIVMSLLILFLSLHMIVRLLKSMVLSRIEVFFDRYIFKIPVRAFVLGWILTIIVQSSSFTTSLVIPLAGAGILVLRQIFPYTLGANLGTTVTAFLAALAIGRIEAVTIAVAHVYFNLFGIIVLWPLRKIPLYLARLFATLAIRNRLIPIIFVLLIFFIIPLSLIIITR